MTPTTRPAAACPWLMFARPLLFAFLLLAAPLPAQAPDSAYTRGKEALAQEDYAKASDLLAQADAGAHPPADTLLVESRALFSADRLPEADRTIRAYLAVAPTSPPALYLLGAILFREDHPKESLESFTRAAALQTPTAEDLRLVALDYVLLDLYHDARRWLTRAQAMEPRNPEVLYDLGRVEMHDGNFTAARQDFEASLSLAPRSAKALNNLGLTLEAMNRPAEALTSYARAIAEQSAALHPSEQPLLNQGALLITLNRSPEAIAPLRRAIEIAPACVRCHEELARSLAANGHLPSAIEQLNLAIRLEPTNPRLHFQLGRTLRRAGFTQQGDAELKQSAALYGTHSSVPTP